MYSRAWAPEEWGEAVWAAEEDLTELISPQLQEWESILEAIESNVGANAEELAEFVATLKKIGNSVVSALPVILPAIGTAIGGPVGGVIGGVAGTAVTAATSAAKPLTPTPPKATPPRSPAGRAPQVPGSPAAAQLLSLLFRPEITKALMAMVLGPVAKRSLTIGGKQVPLSAFANLLAVLSQLAAFQYAAAGREEVQIPDYLIDEGGNLRCDPAVPEERAQVLWELLTSSSGEEADLAPEELSDEFLAFDFESGDLWEESYGYD